MPIVVYLDETGDHSMKVIDRDFPIFGLVMVIVDIDTYINYIVPAMYRLKMETFGHEGIVLHSYEIRKKKNAFTFLNDQTKTLNFYERIKIFMSV